MSKKSASKQRSKTSKSKSFLSEEAEVFYRMICCSLDNVGIHGWRGEFSGYCFDISNKGNINITTYYGITGQHSMFRMNSNPISFKDKNAIVLIPLLQKLTDSGKVPLTHLEQITKSDIYSHPPSCMTIDDSKIIWETLVNYFKDLKDKKVSLSIKKDSNKKYIDEIQLVNQQLHKCKEEIEYLKGKLIMESQDYKEEIQLLKQQLKNK